MFSFSDYHLLADDMQDFCFDSFASGPNKVGMCSFLITLMLLLALPLGAAEVPKKIPLTPEVFYVVRDGKTVFGTINKAWKSQSECDVTLQGGIRKHPKCVTHAFNFDGTVDSGATFANRKAKWGKVQFRPKMCSDN